MNWSPREADFGRVIGEQMPWLRNGEVPSLLAPEYQRPLARLLWGRLIGKRRDRFQIILGPRRVGKTTVLYQTVGNLLKHGVRPGRIAWWRLDHPLLSDVPLGDLVRTSIRLARSNEDSPLYLMLDELVYAKDWDLWLKTFYDEAWPVRIAATSSATSLIRRRIMESGVGRWEEHHLLPFQFDEYLDLMGISREIQVGNSLYDTIRRLPLEPDFESKLPSLRQFYLLTGGFPELLIRHDQASLEGKGVSNVLLESQRTLRSDAVERAIYKDIPQSFGLNSPMTLERLFYTLGGQISGILSTSGLAQELGITQPTIDRYLSYLERAFLIFLLPNYSGAESNVQRRLRKLYFVDSAVRNAALQRGLAPLDDPVELGLLLENLAAASLHALGLHSGVRVHHWRRRHSEVDLIYADPRQPMAFEIASSGKHTIKGIQALMSAHSEFRGNAYIVSASSSSKHPSSIGEVGQLSLDLFLLALGAQSRRAQDERMGAGATFE